MNDDGRTAPDGTGSPVRVAVVGAGSFGALHARAVQARPDATLAALVDLVPERATAVRDDLGLAGSEIVVADDLGGVLGSGDIDAVSVVVGGAQRVRLALEALDAGCAVLVEKPVAMTSADGRRIADRAAGAGAIAMPAHILRFADPYARVHGRIRAGEIGAPVAMRFRRHRGRDHDVRFPDVHPVLMTMIHDLDLALWFAAPRPGASARVLEAHAVRGAGAAQPESVHARVELAGGVVCEFDVSWSLGPDDDVPDACVVEGTRGTLGVDLGDLREAGLAEVGPDSRWLTPDDGGGALGAEIGEFVRAAATSSPPRTVTFDDAVAGLRLAEAIIAESEASR